MQSCVVVGDIFMCNRVQMVVVGLSEDGGGGGASGGWGNNEIINRNEWEGWALV